MKYDYDIVYMGGKQAGLIGLLTVLASGCHVRLVVAYDSIVREFAEAIPTVTYDSIVGLADYMRYSDFLLSVHGREIVPQKYLDLPKQGCINLHPCLKAGYPGVNPVNRFLKDGKTLADVSAHRMVEKVDAGEIIHSEFTDISDKKTAVEVYNLLYPLYPKVILEVLKCMK